MGTQTEDSMGHWAETYEDFEGADVVTLIRGVGERLAQVCLDESAVDQVMISLHEALGLPSFPADHVGDRSWRTLWSETQAGDAMELPLAQRLVGLNAYAFGGLSPVDGICEIDDIKRAVVQVRTALGLEVDLAKLPDIHRTLLAADARLAIDEGHPVGPEPLAAIARLGIKSVRNAFAPSSGSGLSVKDGKATPESAREWLMARGDFRPSMWRRDQEEAIVREPVSGEIIWVPFAKDGTAFHPEECRRAGKYVIGPKGAEQVVEDYDAALDLLSRMRPVAYWRRPNSAGNWGIVTAVGFRPVTREELSSSNFQVRK